MSTPRAAAWTHGIETATEIEDLLATWDGHLGAVLYPHHYTAAPNAPLRIAYITGPYTAELAADAHASGHRFGAALYLDEGNAHGVDPEAYARDFERVRAILEPAGIPTSTMGLATRPTDWLRELLQLGRYDTEYANRLPTARLRAWNPNSVRPDTVRRTLNTAGPPWLLSPAPYRPVPRTIIPYAIQNTVGMTVARDAALMRHPNVFAVVFWNLREYGPPYEWGLHRRDGTLTSPGRALRRALEAA